MARRSLLNDWSDWVVPIIAGMLILGLFTTISYAIYAHYEFERLHPCIRYVQVPHHQDAYDSQECNWIRIPHRRTKTVRSGVHNRRTVTYTDYTSICIPYTQHHPAQDWTTTECAERANLAEQGPVNRGWTK